MGLTAYADYNSKRAPAAEGSPRRDAYLMHGRRHTEDELAEAERRAGDLRLAD